MRQVAQRRLREPAQVDRRGHRVRRRLRRGAVPLPRASYVNALQWAIGLELFLLVDDPWRVVLTTDHPNGAPFTSYPHLIRLLMDKPFRDEQLAKLHPEAAASRRWRDDARVHALRDRDPDARRAGAAAGPRGPRPPGRRRRGGHRGLPRRADREAMFRRPAWVFKDGVPVVREGEVTDAGRRHALRRAGLRRGIEQVERSSPTGRPAARLRRARRSARRAVPLRAPAGGCCRRPASSGACDALNGVADRRHLRRGVPDDGDAARRHRARPAWARTRPRPTGFATSVIGCGSEAGIERELAAERDARRPARRRLLLFAMSGKDLAEAVVDRVGQCVLTCPTTACYTGLADGDKPIRARRQPALLRRRLADQQAARRPALLARAGDGRRVRRARRRLRHGQGVGGGNFLMLGARPRGAALAARRGGGGGAMRKRAGRDPAVPRRRGALGLQGRQPSTGLEGLDQRRLLPDARAPAWSTRCPTRCAACSRSSSTA